MTKGIVITEHGYYHEYEYETLAQIQDVAKGYVEGLALYDVQGNAVGYMYMNEMGHGLINTPASALSFMFGGASTIKGNVLVSGPTTEDGGDSDVLPTIQEMIAYTSIKREDPVNV